MVNCQACYTAGCKKKKSPSPHDARSLNWLVNGQVSPKGPEQLFVPSTVVEKRIAFLFFPQIIMIITAVHKHVEDTCSQEITIFLEWQVCESVDT